MKRTLQFLCMAIALSVFGSCASIVSKSVWPLELNSNPEGARVTITNRKGDVVFNGTTPGRVELKASAGFFKKESYSVKLELDGYTPMTIPVECKVNGWYWGNILFGGFIGWLIVDPATGAMYKLNRPGIDAMLQKNTTGSVNTERSLKISSIGDIPKDMRGQLVRIN
ncbi:MAG TPA: hypothetical protein VHD83_28980 [Puia sp.]|nr:hypothetical protein [Puia sp.]